MIKIYLHIALAAIKKNWLPGLIIQLFAFSIVIAYYCIPPFQIFLTHISDLKQEGGYLFSAIVTAVFGGFIPFIVQMLVEKEQLSSLHLKTGVFLVLFWAYRGVEVDLFYQYQAIWFGDNLSVLTIVKKTLADQFVYAPFWSIAIVVLGVLFKDCQLSFKEFKNQLDKTFITQTYPSILFSTWIIWIPAVAIIYSLPLLLQVPMMNLVACFYAILVMYMTRHRKELLDGTN